MQAAESTYAAAALPPGSNTDFAAEPPALVLAPTLASPGVQSNHSAEHSQRSIMEGRVHVAMELLLRTLRLANAPMGGPQSNPFAPQPIRNSLSPTPLPSISLSISQEPLGGTMLNPATQTQTILNALFNEHRALQKKYEAVSNQHLTVSKQSQSQNVFRDKQRLTQLQRQAKQLLLDISIKKSHIDANAENLRKIDPEGAEAFLASASQEKAEEQGGLQLPKVQSLFGSLSGGSISGTFSTVSLSGGSFPGAGTSFSSSMQSLPSPVSSIHQQQQQLQQQQQQQQQTQRVYLDPSTVLILRRLSILVASAFAASVDPFGTHFLLHSLILIRRFLFPSSPRPDMGPETEEAILSLKQDPVSLYLCSLMLVECQLRDGQTSTQIWRKWLKHAINTPSESAIFDGISAKLVFYKRTLVMALDHNILISTSEYDMFLKVFRGCLSARNSKTFSESYVENQSLMGRIGGSEGGPRLIQQLHQQPHRHHLQQQQQQQQQQQNPTTHKPFSSSQLAPISLAPIRMAVSYNAAGPPPRHAATGVAGAHYSKSPLATISSIDSHSSLYSLPKVGSPLSSMTTTVHDPMRLGGLQHQNGSIFSSGKRFLEPESAAAAHESLPLNKKHFRG